MRLEFGVGVRADFAVQIDLFMLRCGPFHGRRSFVGVMQDPERVAQVTKEGNTEEPRQPRQFASTSLDRVFVGGEGATTYRQNEDRESQRVVVVLDSTVGHKIQQNLHRGREFPLTTL